MIFSIEGNIGSGKSTFCKYLKEYFSKYYNEAWNSKVIFVDEPVDVWESIKDTDGNLLEHFYKSPENEIDKKLFFNFSKDVFDPSHFDGSVDKFKNNFLDKIKTFIISMNTEKKIIMDSNLLLN